MAERIIRHTAPHGIARHAEVEHQGEILVVGLGRFGSALASALVENGYEVLAVDSNLERVQEHADMLTHVVQADATNERVLRQLGAADVVTAAVCIGTDIESSVLATSALVDIGVPNVWVKAITGPHGRILQRVGAHHVINPEAEMGNRVAHLITGEALEYVALDDDFVLVELIAPRFLFGVPLGESGVRARYKITVVCVKHEGGSFTYAERDTVLGQSDLIVVAGLRDDVERFAEGSR